MVETGVLAVLSPYLAGLLEGDGAPTTAPPIADTAPRPTVARIEYEDEDPAEHDPDDPEEEEGSLPINGEPEAVESAEIELDADEREWHRVWADEPPARPAHAVLIKLSFLPEPELIKRRALAWESLGQLDAAVGDGRDPSNAVAFGILLAPFIPATELRGGELHAAINELAHPLIAQLHVTRRDSERLRYILMAQRKLAAARKRGAQAELSGGRELIDDSVLLYALLERAAGNEGAMPEPIAMDEGKEDADEDDDPNRPRKRRRRRRGGRRRRGEATA
jgi:hypothetical protein